MASAKSGFSRPLGIAALVLLSAGAAGIWRSKSASRDATPTLARPADVSAAEAGVAVKPLPAPSFTLPRADGRSVSLSDFRDQPVVVHFWATWCAPCVHEIPQFLEFARSQEGRPVRFVAVSLDDSWAKAHQILPEEKLPPNVVSLLDVDSAVPDAFGSFQFPETYLLSSDHLIVGKYVGAQDWKGAVGQEIAARALRP